ncbi:putative membrane protein YccC [Rhodococcus sp. 27YEA15]|uniref:FUSC family protein n=1 Tax=Rhodococcus sp. 27YEA15 TaxID=3156259 RepID=UPI003C7E33BE
MTSEKIAVPIPRPARAVLFGLPPVGNRLPGAIRAALSLAVPATVATLLGFGPVSLLVGLGAFASIYGEGRPYRSRWKVVGAAAGTLTVLSWIGASVGEPIHRAIAGGASSLLLVVVVLVMAVVVSCCAFTVDALRLGAPGSFFFLLTTEISSVIATPGLPPLHIALWTAVGGLSAVVVSSAGALRSPRSVEKASVAAASDAVENYLRALAGAEPPDSIRDARAAATLRLHDAWQSLYRGSIVGGTHPCTQHLELTQQRMARARTHDPYLDGDPDAAYDVDGDGTHPPLKEPTVAYRFLRACHPSSRATTTAVRLLIACVVAGTVTIVLGIDRPDWAVIAAAMVLHQGPDRILGTYRGVHRIGGTVLGLVLLAAIYAWSPTGLWGVLVLALLQLAIELFLVRNYGIAVIFITPLAILLGAAGGAHGSMTHLMLSRLLETTVGVLVAVAVLWTVRRHSHRRALIWSDERTREILQQLLSEIAARQSDRERSVARLSHLRRDLDWELRGGVSTGIDAAHNEPDWAATRWSAHSALHQLGSEVLDRLWFGYDVSQSRLDDWQGRLAEFDGPLNAR